MFHMIRIFRFLLLALLFLIIAYAVLWGTLALWYKLPGSELLVLGFAASFAAFGIGTLVAFFTSMRWRFFAAFVAALIAVNVWWN